MRAPQEMERLSCAPISEREAKCVAITLLSKQCGGDHLQLKAGAVCRSEARLQVFLEESGRCFFLSFR